MSTTNVAVLLQLFSKHTLASLLSRNPTFRPSCVFLQMARIMLCKTRPDPIWFWLTVSGLAKRIRSGVEEPLSLLLAIASEPFWTGCESNPACFLGKCWENTTFFFIFQAQLCYDLCPYDICQSEHDWCSTARERRLRVFTSRCRLLHDVHHDIFRVMCVGPTIDT